MNLVNSDAGNTGTFTFDAEAGEVMSVNDTASDH